jgi:pyruvate formate lyase activating enzyme
VHRSDQNDALDGLRNFLDACKCGRRNYAGIDATRMRRNQRLEYLKRETRVLFEITTLLVPGENDRAAEIEAESHWVMEHLGPDVPLHFTAFHPDWKMLETPAAPPATLRMTRQIAREVGLRYVFTGNIHDAEGQATYCHVCNSVLIGRNWYDLTTWTLSADGRCKACGTPCASILEGTRGKWGRRRQTRYLAYRSAPRRMRVGMSGKVD